MVYLASRRARFLFPVWLCCSAVLGLAFCAPTNAPEPNLESKSEPEIAPPASDTPVPLVVLPGGETIEVEIAANDVMRAQGLMFRESLQPGHGMLFLFDESEIHLFWMKNTLIPLDMIWLDDDQTVVHIASDVAPCTGDPCPNHGPTVPTRHVLELGAGEAAKLGLEVGNHLEFRNLEGVVIR